MSDLLELAERCEKATGPDRGLDAEIAAALHVKQLTYQSPEWIKDPEFTASLDAAMIVVPEEWTWHVNEVGRAACFKPNDPKPWPRVGGLALTPALALCAAALRARAASGMEARQGGNEVPCEARQPDPEGTPKP